MKYLVLAFVALAISTSAFADGFVCETLERDLNVKMFNNTDPSEGTRNIAFMVFSDPAVKFGRKTIASFSAEKNVLSEDDICFMAKVDLRVKESNRKGELIAGTKLGKLEAIYGHIDFSYANPVASGELVKGSLVLVKRDGSTISRELECTRYLKGGSSN